MTKLEKFLITYLYISEILALIILINLEYHYNIKIISFLLINPLATIVANMLISSYIQDKKEKANEIKRNRIKGDLQG